MFHKKMFFFLPSSGSFSGLHFLCAVRRLSSSSSTARVAATVMATESISLNPLSFARLTINPSSQFLKRKNLSCRIRRTQFGAVCSKTSDYQGNIISPILIVYISVWLIIEAYVQDVTCGSVSTR